MTGKQAFAEYSALLATILGGMYYGYHNGQYKYWMGAIRAKDIALFPFTNHRANDLRIVDAPNATPQEEQNVGLHVQGPILNDSETVLLYRILKDLVTTYGSEASPQHVRVCKARLEDAGLPPSIAEGAKFLAPISVGSMEYIPSLKLWGSGDAMRLTDLPAPIRHVTEELRKTNPLGMGNVRLVMAEYYPSGVPMMEPRRYAPYIGYDYYVMPIRAPAYRDVPAVLTLSPTLRSKMNDMGAIANASWTNRDWDALVHQGCVLRVFSQARFDWRLGSRPVQWFGSPENAAMFDRVQQLGNFSGRINASAASAGQSGAAGSPWWKGLLGGTKGVAASSSSSSSALACPSDLKEDKGIILLTIGFTGTSDKDRTMTGMPESMYFGPRPVDQRSKWDDAGRSVWSPINWDEIRSWSDVKSIAVNRFYTVMDKRTRNFAEY